MNYTHSLAIALTAMISIGCTTKVQPYHVAKVLEHQSRLSPQQLPYGVTQEKLAEHKYRITSKLNEYSTPKRVREMTFFHAANLSIQQGFSGFIVRQPRSFNWCNVQRNNKTKILGKVSGGLSYRMVVTLTNNSQTTQYKAAAKLQETLANKLKQSMPNEELEHIAKERIQFCTDKAQTRTGQHILSDRNR